MTPLVSVVVPNYNHRRFLPERLRSVFTQTYRNLEIVFLDDASTDGSLEYVRSLQSPFPLRIRTNDTNGGSAFRQWHRGVSDARGEFVWIAESDDSCAPDLIERLLAIAVSHPEVGLAYAQSKIIDENGREIESFLDYTDEIDDRRWRHDYVNSGRDEAARYLVVRNTVPNASACLFRRAALLDADLESIALRVSGDWLAYARIFRRLHGWSPPWLVSAVTTAHPFGATRSPGSPACRSIRFSRPRPGARDSFSQRTDTERRGGFWRIRILLHWFTNLDQFGRRWSSWALVKIRFFAPDHATGLAWNTRLHVRG